MKKTVKCFFASFVITMTILLSMFGAVVVIARNEKTIKGEDFSVAITAPSQEEIVATFMGTNYKTDFSSVKKTSGEMKDYLPFLPSEIRLIGQAVEYLRTLFN